MFTTNQVCAAPVRVCVPRVKARARPGLGGQLRQCQCLHWQTRVEGCPRKWSGSPNKPLSLPRVWHWSARPGALASPCRWTTSAPASSRRRFGLGSTPAHAAQAAEAIMTSDTRPKQVALEFKLGRERRGWRHLQRRRHDSAGHERHRRSSGSPTPHATMLCFITTDAAIEAGALQAALKEAVASSFNRITVDGDMSTNDTVIVMANGLAGNLKSQISNLKSENFRIFQSALSHVCLELARMIVRDGEGYRALSPCASTGRKRFAMRKRRRGRGQQRAGQNELARRDPNWGRIIDALGYSPQPSRKRKWISATARRAVVGSSGASSAASQPGRPSKNCAPPLHRKNLTSAST